MKNKSILKYLLLTFVLACFGIQSCQLESEVYDAINPTIFPRNANDVKSLVTANAYGVFRNNGWEGMFTTVNGILVVSDLMSDYGECTWRQWVPILYGRWTIDNEYINRQYQYAKFISKMTLTIERIKGVEMDESLKAKYNAELRCGRGWLAFCMYDLFGPIPIADLETLQTENPVLL